MLAECSRRSYQGVSSLDLKFRREPWLLQDPELSPLRRCEVVLCPKMFSQRSQQYVPSLVAGGRGLILQQRWLHVIRLPSILLQELPDQLPPRLIIGRS